MEKQKNKITDALKTLQYNHAWVDYSLMDEEFLLTQLQQFLESDDKNTEHYRYAAY